MKKLISFCLWGDNPKYCVGAVKNAMLRKEIYPDWISRFYVHKDVPQKYIDQLLAIDGTEVVIKNSEPDWTFTTERFKAIDGEDVERVIFRDTDSRLSQREKDAVDEWIKEGTTLHVMRDHPFHGSFPILAGMFGLYKKTNLGSMTEALLQYSKAGATGSYHYDQIFLNYFWPKLRFDATLHDEFFAKSPFPTQRKQGEFVGQVFDENDQTSPSHIKALNEAL